MILAFHPYLNNEMLLDLISKGKTLAGNTKQDYIANKAIKCTYSNIDNVYSILCLEMESYDLTVEVSEFIYNNNDVDFVMLWHPIDDRFRISFRTNKTTVDLSKIACYLGGGGHAKKSGATIIKSPWNLVERT